MRSAPSQSRRLLMRFAQPRTRASRIRSVVAARSRLSLALQPPSRLSYTFLPNTPLLLVNSFTTSLPLSCHSLLPRIVPVPWAGIIVFAHPPSTADRARKGRREDCASDPWATRQRQTQPASRASHPALPSPVPVVPADHHPAFSSSPPTVSTIIIIDCPPAVSR